LLLAQRLRLGRGLALELAHLSRVLLEGVLLLGHRRLPSYLLLNGTHGLQALNLAIIWRSLELALVCLALRILGPGYNLAFQDLFSSELVELLLERLGDDLGVLLILQRLLQGSLIRLQVHLPLHAREVLASGAVHHL